MAYLLFKADSANQTGVLQAMAADQTAIDNAVWINGEAHQQIDISTDQYNQIKQDLLVPEFYDDNNNITWRDMSEVGQAPIWSTEDLEQQRDNIVSQYQTIKSNWPSHPKMSEIDSAISLFQGLDFSAVGGTDDKNPWYYAYQADSSYLHILEIM